VDLAPEEHVMGERARTLSSTALEQHPKSFAQALRQLRRKLAEKQTSLSHEMGCSDAAISHWESGSRLPSTSNFHRLLIALAGAGAASAEMLALRAAWQSDRAMRIQVKMRGKSFVDDRIVDHAAD
jgi:DNA-binding transcriptional regulator YiaG